MSAESPSGQEDTPGASGAPTTSTDSDPPNQQQRHSRSKHALRLPGMPPINLSTSAPLVGTPYSFNQPPFEYPFPSSAQASTPLPHFPTYIPSLPPQSPFPFAPALLHRGNGNAHGYVGVESLGLRPSLWRRNTSPPHSKFPPPSRVDPPMPPGLKQRVKEKLQNVPWVSTGEKGRDGKESTAVGTKGQTSHPEGEADDPGTSTADREGTAEKPRPQSPDVT